MKAKDYQLVARVLANTQPPCDRSHKGERAQWVGMVYQFSSKFRKLDTRFKPDRFTNMAYMPISK